MTSQLMRLHTSTFKTSRENINFANISFIYIWQRKKEEQIECEMRTNWSRIGHAISKSKQRIKRLVVRKGNLRETETKMANEWM